MIYLIKFIYQTFLLPPGIFIIVFLLVSLKLLRKHSSLGKILAVFTFLFYLSSTPLVGDLFLHSLEAKYAPPSNVKGDVIVVLGGGATLDTPNLSGKGHLSGSAANRLLTGLQLYHKFHLPILVSGGQVFQNTGREAEIARGILRGLGVPEEKIILENKSLNTLENAQYTKNLLLEHGYHYPILVTSAFHMPRAIKQFEKVGVKVTSYPTDYRTNSTNIFTSNKLVPSAQALEDFSLALKEYLGLLAIRLY